MQRYQGNGVAVSANFTIQAQELLQTKFSPQMLQDLINQSNPASPVGGPFLFKTIPGQTVNPDNVPRLAVLIPAASGWLANATNATPIVVTGPGNGASTPGHNLSVGDVVVISGVTGNTGMNGTWVVSAVGGGTAGTFANTFTLTNSVGNGSATLTGAVITKFPKVGQYLVNYVSGAGGLAGYWDVWTPQMMANFVTY
jgi:hypothetical protein